MASWLQNYRQNQGRAIAQVGGIISAVPSIFGGQSQNLRVGGGSGLGARVAGQSQPYFDVTQLNRQTQTAKAFTPSVSQPMASYNPNPGGGTPPPGGGGGNIGDQNPGDIFSQGQNNINTDQQNFDQIIEQDYNNAISYIDQQEQSLRGQAGVGTAQIESEGAKAVQSVGAEEATRRAGLQGQQQTAEKTATSSTQQARDLFRQIQQQNIAQLSGLGISSSSVAEALAERLGVETARRIAGITGSLDEVRQNVSKELARVGDFYAQKKTEIQNAITLQTKELQNSLLQGLAQLSAARGQAASDKASRRAELLSNTNNALLQLKIQADQYQKALNLWAQQKSETLNSATSFAVNGPDIQAFQNQTQNLVAGLQPATGFNYTPSFEVNPVTGKTTSKIKYGKATDEEDLSNPF